MIKNMNKHKLHLIKRNFSEIDKMFCNEYDKLNGKREIEENIILKGILLQGIGKK